LGDHGQWCKHTNYEEAARIPLIVYDPRAKQGRGKSDSLVESVDVYPTLCKLAGLAEPKGLDGASFDQVLDDPAAATKDSIIHVFPRGNRIGRAVRTARYRLVEWKVPGDDPSTAIYELYDYEADPGENKNLAGEKPDVVQELAAVLAKQPEAKPQVHADASAKQAKAGKQKKRVKQKAGSKRDAA
jgi:iduronate 2-sulfatase